MRMLWKWTALMLTMATMEAATPAQARSVRESYDKSLEAWKIKMRLAESAAEREKLAEARPSPEKAARQMWAVISGDLDKEWVIEPAAWFLRMASKLVTTGDDGMRRSEMSAEVEKVREAVTRYHLDSERLAPMCMAFVDFGDQASLRLLRRIEEESPHKDVAGVAALGIAMRVKDMGEGERIMRERLSMLRKAIIDAAHVEIDGVTVAELADEELYIITNLSEGRQAPDLTGVDSGEREMTLSDYSGNVVMLVFWNSQGGADRLLDWIRALREDERFKDAPFEVVGVNNDPRPELREMEKSGRIDWPNFSDPENELAEVYRVGARPLCYVLGPDRAIHYVGTIGTFAEVTAAAVLEEQ